MYEDEIARVLSAGIPPIELRVATIRRCDTDEPRGYAVRAVVNSLDLGTLTPADYLQYTDADAIGLALLARTIEKSFTALGGVTAAGGRTPIVVHAPLLLLAEKEPERWLAEVLSRVSPSDPQALCLCFDARLLTGYGTDTRERLLRLKRSGAAIAVKGCGADDVPLAPLLRLPVDFAFLSPEATALAGDRIHNSALSGLVTYLSGMGQAVIAEGVTSEAQRRALDSMECDGYLPSEALLKGSGRQLWAAPAPLTEETGGADIG